MFATIGNPAGNLVIAKGRTDLSFKWTIIRFCCAPVVIYLASIFNVEAVAYSQVILQFIFFFVYWKMMIYPLSDLNLWEYIGSFSKPFICGLIAIIPTLIYAYYVTLPIELVFLIVGCGIFSVIYLISTWFINKPIVTFFKSLLKK
jgi:O-antigen/teichoic acid export membrane protein